MTVDELKTLLRSDSFTTKECLSAALSKFLESTPRGKFKCNLAPHKNSLVQITMNRGKAMCGCFACNVTCRNAIDIYQSFGGYDFKEAVILASEDFGLIDHSSADELRNGRKATTQNIVPMPKIEKKVNYWYEKMDFDVDKANKIYRMFSNLNGYAGKSRLSEEHQKELLEKRKLSREEINQIGFFTYPKVDIKYLIDKMRENGLVEEDLKYIPGFYFDKTTKKWDYHKLKGEAYGIPIMDVKGRVSAIQIRMTGKDVQTRYFWFASSNAMLKPECPNSRITYGNSPGTPLTIVRPKLAKTTAVLITEGFFKAYTFAREYGCTAIAVQGVQNIAGIEEVIKELREEGLGKNIAIAFDADMAVNDNVLKPALKLAAKVSGMPTPCFEDLQKLLMGGNKEEKFFVRNLKDEKAKVQSYFDAVSNISFLVWNMNYEKGIDDLILAGHKDMIRSIKASSFVSKAIRLLTAFDNEKEKIAMEKGIKFGEAYVPDEVLKNFFFNIVLEEDEVA